MAYSTCPKCDNRIFELKEISPIGATYILMAVQCSICGAVVGITDTVNNGVLLQHIIKIITVIAQKLGIYIR